MIKRRHRLHSTGSLPNYLLSTSTLATVETPLKLRRSYSLEPSFQRVKPIMKARTLDESLSSIGQSGRRNSEGSLDSSERSIKFHEIQIREYARTVGDNPSCSSGPPMAIAWEYDPNMTTMKLEEYEHLRPRRRSQMEMVIPRHERYRMLREEWDVPSTVIAASVRNAVKVKHQRRVTVSNLHSNKWEEMVERASRKVTRTLLFRKSTTEQAKELELQLEEANKLRAKWMMQMMERDRAQYEATKSVVAVEPEDEQGACPEDDDTVESQTQKEDVQSESRPAEAESVESQSTVVEPVGE